MDSTTKRSFLLKYRTIIVALLGFLGAFVTILPFITQLFLADIALAVIATDSHPIIEKDNSISDFEMFLKKEPVTTIYACNVHLKNTGRKSIMPTEMIPSFSFKISEDVLDASVSSKSKDFNAEFRKTKETVSFAPFLFNVDAWVNIRFISQKEIKCPEAIYTINGLKLINVATKWSEVNNVSTIVSRYSNSFFSFNQYLYYLISIVSFLVVLTLIVYFVNSRGNISINLYIENIYVRYTIIIILILLFWRESAGLASAFLRFFSTNGSD
jgi:hypothetical protein